jgi:hypothetical protein
LIQTNHFSRIVVIESLPNGNAKTGREIYGFIAAQIRENSLPISAVFEQCESKVEFLSILDNIHKEAVSNNEYPWIHIECHGSTAENGIVLSKGDFISWQELNPEFTKINLACKCNLMIVMAACNGAYLAEILQPMDRAPCWGLLGATNELYPDDLLASFRVFYLNLLSSLSGDAALIALRKVIEERNLSFMLVTALDFFQGVYSGYLSEYCTEKAYWRRAKNMKNGDIKGVTVQDLVLKLKEQEPGEFQKFKNNFFMCDLYPENSAKFPIIYSDVLIKT